MTDRIVESTCPHCGGEPRKKRKGCPVCGTSTGTHWHDYCPSDWPGKSGCEFCHGTGVFKVAIAPDSDPPLPTHWGRKPGRSCSTHCCPIHGCKYGYDSRGFVDSKEFYCPIGTRAIKPEYPNNNGCEQCEADQLPDATDELDRQRARIKVMDALLAAAQEYELSYGDIFSILAELHIAMSNDLLKFESKRRES
jgi:hypothetical protein